MQGKNSSEDYVIRVHDHPSDIEAADWNRLLDEQPSPTPFMRHEYLCALQDSGSADANSGWLPQTLSLHRGDSLVGACPMYLKLHSYGEYVFDWAWADAYQRHGLAYYPKLLSAVPFTPVPGTRLLARDEAAKGLLLKAMTQLATQARFSSVHLLFMDDADRQAAEAAGWMLRTTVQFHWHNRTPQPYASFADFAASLHRDKRKKIQQERRRVSDAGVSFTHATGSRITGEDWDFFYLCHTLTYRAHHSTPYLTRDFFQRLAATAPEPWLMFTAWQGGERVGCSLIAIDPERRTAHGRYWGATRFVDSLHFEACYHRPIEWCIANGYAHFEGGAQGEHKMARGLMPLKTWSAHWLAHPQFASAVSDFLAVEGAGMAQYLDELNDRRPFKA